MRKNSLKIISDRTVIEKLKIKSQIFLYNRHKIVKHSEGCEWGAINETKNNLKAVNCIEWCYWMSGLSGWVSGNTAAAADAVAILQGSRQD